jgi:AcrR family transcriptional regulator
MIDQQVGPRRADAIRNRARVVAAAAEVFAERGLDASVPEVAARAGVGKATVYRSFPTKEHLVAAVVIDHLHDFEARIYAALDAEDAWTAFVDLVVEQTQAQMNDRARWADSPVPSTCPSWMRRGARCGRRSSS